MHHVVDDRRLFVHCAGHSLGAHVCALTGKLLKMSSTASEASSESSYEEPALPPLDRISAMDPAGPLFFNDVPYPFNNLNVTSASRLNSSDARLVDVIHTDGDARYLGYIPQVRLLLYSHRFVGKEQVKATRFARQIHLSAAALFRHKSF